MIVETTLIGDVGRPVAVDALLTVVWIGKFDVGRSYYEERRVVRDFVQGFASICLPAELRELIARRIALTAGEVVKSTA